MDDLIRRQDAQNITGELLGGWLTDEERSVLEKVEVELGELDSVEAELTRDEAYAIAEFIDFNIFNAIRNDPDWDSMYALRNLIHAYEKCCWLSGYLGASDERRET